MTNRIEKEKKFHNERFAEDSRKHLDKYYSITTNARDLFIKSLKNNVTDLKILEYGCGEGSYSFELAKLKAKVFGIDISDVAIENAKKLAIETKLNDNLDFRVMNAEELDFPDKYFDKICGNSILHHLELNKALLELNRVLKIEGSAIFIEPLGHNPFINLYRSLTKDLRTEDEHPLKIGDLDLFKDYFEQVTIHYFNLTTLLAIPFRKFSFFKNILSMFNKLDSILFKFSFMQKNAWIILVELSGPKKMK
jgi:ubiquinone/menaquinone biosynthesis C-methylase UbiE